MNLQDTFYVMGIIYMAIMFIVMIAAVVAIFAIKAKVNAIHKEIEAKLQVLTNVAHIGTDIVDGAKKVFRGRK